MKYIIHEKSGSAYTKKGKEFYQHPLSAINNNWNKNEGGLVTDWESPSMRRSVEKAWEKQHGGNVKEMKQQVAEKMSNKELAERAHKAEVYPKASGAYVPPKMSSGGALAKAEQGEKQHTGKNMFFDRESIEKYDRRYRKEHPGYKSKLE